MDSLKVNFSYLNSIISNVIRREVDCLTDELYKADTIYVLADKGLAQDPASFLSLNSRKIKLLKDFEEESSSNSVLLGIFFKEVDDKIIEQVKAFNQSGRTVLITNEYNNGDLLHSRETIGMHVPAEVESAEQKTMLIKQALHLILDDINLKIKSKEASKPVM